MSQVQSKNESALVEKKTSVATSLVFKLISSLFKKYHDQGLTTTEVKGMLQMILEGESVILDDIDSEDLRKDLKCLFLEFHLTEAATDEDGALGFGLPENKIDEATQKVNFAIKACNVLQSDCRTQNLDFLALDQLIPQRIGPALSIEQFKNNTTCKDEDDRSDDDLDQEGPVLDRLSSRKPTVDNDQLDSLAKKRKFELDVAMGKRPKTTGDVMSGQREDWMINPGEHDFLKSVSLPNAQIKSRSFKNERVRGLPVSNSDPSNSDLNPELKAEMDRLAAAHSAMRGPALIDIHRDSKKKEKDKQRKEGTWKWSRDKDLDHGRRVDKDALHMIMGGASDHLKDKFQGSMSRSFM